MEPSLADHRSQHHLPRDASLPRQGWVNRVNPANQKTGGNTLGNPDTLWGSDLGHGYGGGTDNPADHAAHLAARNSSRNASNDAARPHHRRRSFVFLNHLNFLGNLGGGAELPVHDIGLNLLHDLDRSSCRRRRWRRRGWGHQECHQLLLRQGFGKDEGHQNHETDQTYFEEDRECRGSSPPGLQPATRFQKTIFKHKSVLPTSEPT